MQKFRHIKRIGVQVGNSAAVTTAPADLSTASVTKSASMTAASAATSEQAQGSRVHPQSSPDASVFWGRPEELGAATSTSTLTAPTPSVLRRIVAALFALFAALIYAANAHAQEFLTPDEAFKIRVQKQPHASVISIELGRQIYLYASKFHARLGGEEITADLELPAPSEHDGEAVYFGSLGFLLPDFARGRLALDFQGCSEAGLCYQPMRALLRSGADGWELERVGLASALGGEFSGEAGGKSGQNKLSGRLANSTARGGVSDADSPAADSLAADLASDETAIAQMLAKSSAFIVLAAFFGFGVMLSLTPCVLPMLPILSAVLARKCGRAALLASVVYVLAMAGVYALAGLAAAAAGSGLGAWSQSAPVQGAFALLFVALAASSFGAFSLQLPGRLQRLSTRADGTGGLAGAAAMGALSALLVGPCVAAPLAGALVYIANSGDFALGGAALFALGLGMGVPLLALGAGFSALKSGAWMQRINQIFGFLMLGTAVFFARHILGDLLAAVGFCAIICAAVGHFWGGSAGDGGAAGADGADGAGGAGGGAGGAAKGGAKFTYIKRIGLLAAASAGFWLVLTLLAPGGFAGASGEIGSAGVSAAGAATDSAANGTSAAALFQPLTRAEQLSAPGEKLLYFTADWCENCQIYHREIFPRTSALIAAHQAFAVDLTAPDEFARTLAKNYQVFGPPVFVRLRADGTLAGKLTGLVSAEKFKNFLN